MRSFFAGARRAAPLLVVVGVFLLTVLVFPPESAWSGSDALVCIFYTADSLGHYKACPT